LKEAVHRVQSGFLFTIWITLLNLELFPGSSYTPAISYRDISTWNKNFLVSPIELLFMITTVTQTHKRQTGVNTRQHNWC